MTIDKQQLQKLLWAEAASFRADCANWKRNTEALDDFLGEKTVGEVALELLAENECLREEPNMRAIRSLRGDCADLIAERDQLKAKNEALLSLLGQSALAATTLRTDAEAYANHSGFNRAFVDLIRARSGVEVGHGYGSSKYPQQSEVLAAMGKGEQP